MSFTTILDSDLTRGDLTFIEIPQDIGFEVKRIFYIYGSKAGTVRGGHAHKVCQQVLICLNGWVIATIDNIDYSLSKPGMGVMVYPGEFVSMTFADPDSVLLVLSSEHFSREDYISEYQVS